MSQAANGSTLNDTKYGSYDGVGLFSGNPKINPYYHNWSRVILRYCDGTYHQGSRKNPIVVNGKKLYFRGYDNVVGAF